MRIRRLVFVLAALAAVLACTKRSEEGQPPPSASASEPVGVLAPREQLRTLAAPEGDVAAIVRETARREASIGRKVLVYIGAAWCEPCQRFHAAAARGDLDKAFSDVSLLEFDIDHDRERLAASGYVTRLIPYFGVPGPDGRATSAHIEGSIKGDGAVGEIVPRLSRLMGR